MSRILNLTRIMIKSSDNSNVLPEKNKKFTIAMLVILFIYLGGLAGVFFYYVISMLDAYSQAALSIYLLFSATSIYLLIMSFLLIPSIYYFSKDIHRYLVMPISAREFMIARFLNTLASLYLTLSFIYIPFAIAYSMIVGFSLKFLLLYTLAGLIIPLVPLAMSLLVIVIVFKFIPFFRNKNLFTYVTMIISIGFGVAMSMVSSSNMDPELMMEALIEGIQTGSNTLINLVSSIFVNIPFLSRGIANENLLDLTIGIILSLVFVILIITLIQGLYLESALSIQEESVSKKALTQKAMNQAVKQRSVLWTLIKVDFKNIIRTPMFAMNYFIMLFLLPIMLVVPLFTNGLASELGALVPLIQDLIRSVHYVDLITYTVCGSFLLSFIFGSLGMIASTAISREGKAMESYKIMPLKLIKIVDAKILLSVICMMIPFTLMTIALGIILKLNIILVLLALFFGTLGSLAANTLNILLDVYKPKLNWTTEQEAIKQNLLSIIPMFTLFAFGGMMFYLIFNYDLTTVLYGSTATIIIISLGIYQVIKKLCDKHLPNLIG